MMSMSCREEEERSDLTRGADWLSRGATTIGFGVGFFVSAILFAPDYGITGHLVVYVGALVGAGVGGFLGHVLDDIWDHLRPKGRPWLRR